MIIGELAVDELTISRTVTVKLSVDKASCSQIMKRNERKANVIYFQQMVVKVGSTSYEMWETLPIPMYMKIYYFNVTNSEDIANLVPGDSFQIESGHWSMTTSV